MSRSELAEAVNRYLWESTGARYELDGHAIARYERGQVRWPSAQYRSGLRGVLQVSSDAELGFHPSRRGRFTEPSRLAPRLESSPPGGVGDGVRNAGKVSIERGEGCAEVVDIRAMSNAFQLADRKVGGGVMYAQVFRYLGAEIGPRLLTAGGVGVAALFTAASSVTEIAGWMAHDNGRDDLARQHFERAYRLAIAADSDAMTANVCASMSHLAGQLRQPKDAVRIAEVGLSHARAAVGTTRLIARLHAMRAHGLARMGQRSSCLAALRTAEDVLAAAANEQPAEWVAGFDEASLASEMALCLRRLGDLAEAERQAREVIALRPGDRVRSRAFGQLTLARILLDGGRVDEAVILGRDVSRLASSLTSQRVSVQLRRLRDALTPHHGSPEVADFLAECGSLRTTGSRAVPAWPV